MADCDPINLPDLPPELLHMILLYLEIWELPAAARICPALTDVAERQLYRESDLSRHQGSRFMDAIRGYSGRALHVRILRVNYQNLPAYNAPNNLGRMAQLLSPAIEKMSNLEVLVLRERQEDMGVGETPYKTGVRAFENIFRLAALPDSTVLQNLHTCKRFHSWVLMNFREKH